MRLQETITLFKRLDRLIRCYATGSPDQLARRLDVSKSTVHRYITELREDFDAPIKFSRDRVTYYYTEDFELRFE